MVLDAIAPYLSPVVLVIIGVAIKVGFDYFVRGASLQTIQQDDNLNTIVEATFDIRDRAITYWAQDAKDSALLVSEEVSISARLTFIGKAVDDLFKQEESLNERVQEKVNHFHESITKGNFRVVGRDAEKGRLEEIEDAAYELVYHARRFRRQLKRPVLRP